ncbi:hypothetical protein [Parasulfitobacter algicola]|uniref:Uncharacterized protein n=1 Tax=Parasulfitobacter algicola TaxID=2614809 RepID=A0ABX2IY40_9RHOB|nr:hypothetical protein [Sulfitobacter algicola]NSX56185.1 hypothetical protein [Sulfitobacter algicola]
MEWLVWIGAAITVAGLGGVIASIFKISAAKKTASDDDVLREKLKKIIPLNLGALFLSMLGLMLVVVGIFLA